MQTQQQKNARLAYKHVNEVLQQHRKKELDKKDYARAVYRFPILVRINGLQQTIGFYAGKASDEGTGQGEQLFLDHLAAALGQKTGTGETLPGKDLPEHIFGWELEEYLLITRRCLEVAIWYRRFVESVLKVDPTGMEGEDQDKTDKESNDVDTNAE